VMGGCPPTKTSYREEKIGGAWWCVVVRGAGCCDGIALERALPALPVLLPHRRHQSVPANGEDVGGMIRMSEMAMVRKARFVGDIVMGFW
jgi:hypothetical protein